jgi:hypothetical protein
VVTGVWIALVEAAVEVVLDVDLVTSGLGRVDAIDLGQDDRRTPS